MAQDKNKKSTKKPATKRASQKLVTLMEKGVMTPAGKKRYAKEAASKKM